MDQNPYESPSDPTPETPRDKYHWTTTDAVFIAIGVLSAIVVLVVLLVPIFQGARE